MTQITAIVPTHERLDMVSRTLERLLACDPAPAEILVHVDGGNATLYSEIEARFPGVRCLLSEKRLGPGGSRNRLIAEAAHDWVANFDDDSYPAHRDYFARAAELARAFPDAGGLSAASHALEWARLVLQRISVFSGCGCVFNKRWFARTRGFVPLPIAYGMEEVDMSLQLHALGGRMIHDPLLRVNHEPPADRARDEQRVAAVVLANTVLLPWLRYPVWLWPAGVAQVLSKIRWMLAHGQTGAVWSGLQMTPTHLLAYGGHTGRVSARALLSWLRLRRAHQDLQDANSLPHGFVDGAARRITRSTGEGQDAGPAS